jgi:predicted nucleic acid-binding protein
VAEGYLLDTNVIPETRKTLAEAAVLAFPSSTDPRRLHVSVLTLGELRKRVTARSRLDPVGGHRLAQWLDTIESEFAGQVLAIVAATAGRWEEFSAARSLPVIGTLIAATALGAGLTPVTRNTGDFPTMEVAVFNPRQQS